MYQRHLRFLQALAAGALGLTLAGAAMAQAATTSTAPAAAGSATASPREGQAGTFKSVQGQVQVRGTDGTLRPARPGDPVSSVEQIITGAQSGAGLVLRDGTTLVLGPDSQLDLKQYHFDATTHEGGILVSLLKGSLRLVSGLIAQRRPEAVRVDTQTATIGIRGTDFIVIADAQQ